MLFFWNLFFRYYLNYDSLQPNYKRKLYTIYSKNIDLQIVKSIKMDEKNYIFALCYCDKQRKNPIFVDYFWFNLPLQGLKRKRITLSTYNEFPDIFFWKDNNEIFSGISIVGYQSTFIKLCNKNEFFVNHYDYCNRMLAWIQPFETKLAIIQRVKKYQTIEIHKWHSEAWHKYFEINNDINPINFVRISPNKQFIMFVGINIIKLYYCDMYFLESLTKRSSQHTFKNIGSNVFKLLCPPIKLKCIQLAEWLTNNQIICASNNCIKMHTLNNFKNIDSEFGLKKACNILSIEEKIICENIDNVNFNVDDNILSVIKENKCLLWKKMKENF